MHNIVQHTADNTGHHVLHPNQSISNSSSAAHGLVVAAAGQDIVTFSTDNTSGSMIIDASTVAEHGGIVSEEICMIVASANGADEGVGENMAIDVDAMDRGHTSLELE